jgi:hypothetical protein
MFQIKVVEKNETRVLGPVHFFRTFGSFKDFKG